jgi:hypothetical protein
MSRIVFASTPVFAKRLRSGSGRLSVLEKEGSRGAEGASTYHEQSQRR